jgi:hypothetical protein
MKRKFLSVRGISSWRRRSRSSGDPADMFNTFGFRVASVSPIPEPTRAFPLLLGAFGVAVRRRR